MKKIYVLMFLTLTLSFYKGEAQAIKENLWNSPGAYLGQKPPRTLPEEFATDFLKVGNMRFQNSSFSPDGKEFLYTVFDEATNSYRIYATRYEKGRWEQPVLAPFLGDLKGKASYEPRHHPNGKLIYLTIDGQLHYSVKKGEEWTLIQKLEDPINVTNTEHASFDGKNNIYFWSNRSGNDDLYKAVEKNGKYASIENLGIPVNSKEFDGDPYMDIKGRYLIFTSTRGLKTTTTEGSWQGDGGTDLYISYWKLNRWTNPKNLGPEINKPDVWNYNPLVTPDGKYFIFGRRKLGEEVGFSKLYWVSTNFIDSLKNTNFEPYVKQKIENQVAKMGKSFSYQIPEETFIDDDGQTTLAYSASLSDGSALPSWLTFDSQKRMFFGVPSMKEEISIKILASDPEEANVSSPAFTIKIVE